jgi:hypothetical protein
MSGLFFCWIFFTTPCTFPEEKNLDKQPIAFPASKKNLAV